MTKNLTEGSPAKLIFFFTMPLIAGNIFQQLYAFVDTLIVGRFLGVNALAAVGCTGALMFLMLGFVIGFSTGLSIYTGQRFGARDKFAQPPEQQFQPQIGANAFVEGVFVKNHAARFRVGGCPVGRRRLFGVAPRIHDLPG